jgi:anti-anti-sigma factor
LRYNRFILITETKTRRVEPDITIFEISGRLNLGNLLQSVESAIRSLIDGGARKLVIDVAGLNSIDSSGIGTLVTCAGQMDQLGGQMRVAGALGSVAKVFETIHIDRIIPLDTDVALACGSFSSSAATA